MRSDQVLSQSEKIKQELLKIFERFDTNGDGTLHIEEFELAMREMMPTASAEELKDLFRAFDHNKSGIYNNVSIRDLCVCTC